MGLQRAFLVPEQLFRRQPAYALQETAFDLPQVDCGIQGGSHVVQDVGAQQARLAGQSVDRDFRNGSAESEVVKRLSQHRLAVVVDIGSAVKAGGRKRDAGRVSFTGQLTERQALRAKMNVTV